MIEVKLNCREKGFDKVIFSNSESKDGVTEKTFREIIEGIKKIIPNARILPVYEWINFETIPVGYEITRNLGFDPSNIYGLITSMGCSITKSSIRVC
jgi:hypothetical protein